MSSALLDELLAQQRRIVESIEPVNVEVLLGQRVVTVRLTYLSGRRFDALADQHSPGIWYRDAVGCWFDLDAVARAYPDVVLIDSEVEDDLLVVRNRQAVYRWGEVYDQLSGADRRSIQSVIWGLYVGDPAERERKAGAGDE